jgi:hypothetical protein
MTLGTAMPAVPNPVRVGTSWAHLVDWSAGRQLQSAAAECSNNCANNRSDLEPLRRADAWTVLKKESEVPLRSHGSLSLNPELRGPAISIEQ